MIDIDNDASREFDYIRTRLYLAERLFDELAQQVKNKLSRYMAFWNENRTVPPEIRIEARQALIELTGHFETANHEAKALHSNQFKELYRLRDVEIFKRYQDDGMTLKELALEYGLTSQGIQMVLNRMRTDEYGVRHALRPYSRRQRSSIHKVEKEKRQILAREEKRQILARKVEEEKRQILARYPGESMREIAKSLSIPRASVARVLRLAGVPMKVVKPRKSGGTADRQLRTIRTM